MEKRKQPRANVTLEVEIARLGMPGSVHTTFDVGLGGMFVEGVGDRVTQVGDEVEVKFVGDDTYSMRARVVRKTHKGLALIFVEFNFEDFMFLEEPLKRQRSISSNALH